MKTLRLFLRRTGHSLSIRLLLIFFMASMAYGYAAWFTMDSGLAPFMQRNPIWPSTFPKALSILGIIASGIILLGLEKSEEKIGDIDYRRLGDYHLGQIQPTLLKQMKSQ